MFVKGERPASNRVHILAQLDQDRRHLWQKECAILLQLPALQDEALRLLLVSVSCKPFTREQSCHECNSG